MDAGLWQTWRHERSSGAFHALVEGHLVHAVGFARRFGLDASDAEDVVQDALVRLAAERTDQPAELGVRTWLFRAIRDRSRVRARAGVRRKRRESHAARREATPPSPGVDLRDAVDQLLGELEEFEREAMLLRYLHELSFSEIAVVLDVSENAARLRVHRALDRLRNRFGDKATTLLAALPLPVLLSQDLIGSAFATAKSATVSSLFGGSTVVATTMTKTTLVAVAAVAVIGVGGWWLTRDDAPASRIPALPAETARATPDAASPSSDTNPAGALANSAVRAAAAFDELAPTEEELAFMRDALLRERERRDRARIRTEDDGLAILDRVLKHGADPGDLLWDFEKFSARVPQAGGDDANISGSGSLTQLTADDLSGVAGVIQLGAGRFELTEDVIRDLAADGPTELRGAGMDRTFVVGSLTYLNKPTSSLRVRDLTIEVGRGKPINVWARAALILERVRFVGLQDEVFYLNDDAYLGARNCEFVGRLSVKHGDPCLEYAMRAVGHVVALFDDCVFRDIGSVLYADSTAAGGSVLHLRDCVLENCRLLDPRFAARAGPIFPVRVRNTAAHFGDAAWDQEQIAREWGAEHAAEVTNVTFAPGIARYAFRDLLSAVESVSADEHKVLMCAHVSAHSTFDTLIYHLVFTDDDRREKERWLVAGRLDVSEHPMSDRTQRDEQRHSYRKPEGEAVSIGGILRQSGIPEDEPVLAAYYGQHASDGRWIPAVVVESQRAKWVFDVRTGARLSGPE